LDLLIKLKHESSTIILFINIIYSKCDLLLTSMTVPDPQTRDMRQIW